jgi:hypothetical protein
MGALPSLVRWLTAAYAVCLAGLLLRLVREGLHARYRYFAVFLAFDTAATLVLLRVEYNTDLYFRLWAAQQAVLAGCYFLIVLEMYGFILRDYPGIAGAFRWLMAICVPAAVAVSLVAAIPGIEALNRSEYPLLNLAVMAERTAVLAVLAFLVVVELILFWFPLILSRNTAAYCVGFLVFFTSQTAGFTLISVFGVRMTDLANVLMQTVSCVCLVFWMATLNRAGEKREVVIGASWKPEEQERMRKQLEQVNQFVSRMAKSILK